MVMKFLKRVYCRIPGIRELVQICESVYETRNLVQRINVYLRQIHAAECLRVLDL
jgi:hypothetical protein